MSLDCPLCLSSNTELFGKNSIREYFRCSNCNLIFTPKFFHLSRLEEQERYAEHENNYEDKKYRDYLSKIISAIKNHGYNFSNRRVIDYGAGENYVLTRILQDRGVEAFAFDPIYGLNIDKSIKYDIIIASESAEHFTNPHKEFRDINSLLKEDGVIAIKTELTDNISKFNSWWYQKDPTHVVFYSIETLNYLAKSLNKRASIITKNLTILEP